MNYLNYGILQYSGHVLETIASFYVLLTILCVLRNIWLLILWLLMRIDRSIAWQDMPEKTDEDRKAKTEAEQKVIQYDHTIEYLYYTSMCYNINLYIAVGILFVFLGVQLVCIGFEML